MGIAPRLQLSPAVRSDTTTPTGPVLVIGGGIAGVSAAVVLAERGAPVTICEAAPQLGGRLGTVVHHLPDGTPQPVDHGFHGFFRQYYNWRNILSRIDPTRSLLQPLGSYPVVSSRFPEEQFDRLPPTPPLSIAALLARSPSLRLRELVRADHKAARHLLAFDTERSYRELDHLSAEEFLTSLRLSPRARAMLFNVFARSFFNHPASMSAAELVSTFHFYFIANPEGLGMDAPRTDYQTAIWTPLRNHLERHGCTVHTHTPITRLQPAPHGGWYADTGHVQLHAHHVIIAVDAASAGRLLAASPAVAADAHLAGVATQPLTGAHYAVARFWTTREPARHRAPFTSISDADLLDSVTLYHHLEPSARRWHQRTGGGVLELHAYALPAAGDPHQLGEAMLAELAELWPELCGLTIVDRHCRLGHDAAGFPVGTHHHRPGVRSQLPGILLAGDWIKTAVPSALMERSATTGIDAANTILSRHGHATEPIWSVPRRGLLAGK